MTLKPKLPEFLEGSDFETAPLNYKWSNGIEDRITDSKHHSLLQEISKLNHRAQFGLATICAELICLRLQSCEYKDKANEILQIVESGWVGLFDKSYLAGEGILKQVDVKNLGERWDDKNNLVLWNLIAYYLNVRRRYYIDSYLMFELIPVIIMLLNQVTPRTCEAQLQDWLKQTIIRSAKLFPTQYDTTEVSKNRRAYLKLVYDSSNEPPICREFYFENDFVYDQAKVRELSQAYLQTVDYATNPFLQNPEDMIKLGFKGASYK